MASGGPVRGDEYEKFDRIGEGGMADVYLARHPRFGKRWIALKQLKASIREEGQALDRFVREARLLESLRHEHIVAVYDYGEGADGPYIALEYIAGPAGERHDETDSAFPPPSLTLQEKVDEEGVFGEEEILDFGLALASAVRYAHEQRVIHRDIKPLNVLIDSHGKPLLTDFGLARHRAVTDSRLTQRFDRMGTFDYMAPEVERDPSCADALSDLFSLGATLVFAATGKTLKLVKDDDFPPLLLDVFRAATASEREDRIQSVAELEERLRTLRALRSSGMSTADVLALKRCRECGARFRVDPREPLVRRYCEGCGASLIAPCLICGELNGAWSRHCRKCGTSAAEALEEERSRLQARRKDILAQGARREYISAIPAVRELAALDDRRFSDTRKWAQRVLEDYEAKDASARLEFAREETEAETALDDRRIDEAIRRLESIPEPYRSAAAKEMLGKARNRAAKLGELREEITRLMGRGRVGDTRRAIQRALEISPHDADLRSLLEQTRRRERPMDEDAWAQACIQNRIDAYRDYLTRFDEGRFRVEAERQLACLLRRRLLAHPELRADRADYIRLRDDALAAEDERHAREGMILSYGLWGMVAGGVVGACVGAVAGFWVTVTLAMLAGAVYARGRL